MVERHILICGEIGVGKSTLIRRLLLESTRTLGGFITKRISDGKAAPVYIHPAWQPVRERRFGQENLIGTSLGQCFPEVFDTYGVSLLTPQPGELLLMDELGFMESNAEVFCNTVLLALSGNIPVLAAVKKRETRFLSAVKNHPNAEVFEITMQNRDELYKLLLPRIRKWNHSI